LHHHFPALAKALGKIAEPRPTPRTYAYVLDTAKKTDAGEYTLLHALQNATEELGEAVVVAECMDHLAAGIDTTGDALCFLMFQLSLPENFTIQHNIYKELDASHDKGFNELSYLDAVVMESLRLYPPIPMSQPRVISPQGKMIDGWFLEGGTVVSAQAWSVHRLNEDVFEDGEVFKPERWVDSERRSEMDKAFFAFGAGARGCTGKQ
jgi:cytochrome P450